jgi:predicted small metal-binding protein
MTQLKVRCPRKGCNYQADVDSAKDAIEGLQEHMRQVHGIDDMTAEDKESFEGTVKAQLKKRS